MFKKYFKSEFFVNVLTLMTGTTIAQAIPIAATPILTRIYSPDDFGILALFTSLTAILGVVATGRYEMAILLPKKEEEALNIVYLSAFITTLFSLVLFVLVFLFDTQIAVLLGDSRIAVWLYLAPVSVWFLGMYNALNLYNVRHKNYRDVSVSMVTKSSGLVAVQVIVGYLKAGAAGLIWGQVVSYISGNLVLLRKLTKKYSIFETCNPKIMKEVAATYVRFPKFTLPGNLMNAVSLNAINFLISNVYTTFALGHFSLASRMLGVPTRVLGSSISQVYFQKISEVKNLEKDVLRVFTKTLKRLVSVSTPIFIAAYFLVEPTFAFIFGEEWRVAGTYAKIIVPLAGIRFVSSALSPSLHVFERQDLTLIIQTIQVITLILLFVCVYYFDWDFLTMLVVYSLVYSLEYIIFIFIYYSVIKKN
jgi:O-antigen/teichoic acid export membrane protein